MPTFTCSLKWTDKGVLAPDQIATRRNLATGEVARAFEVTVTQVLYTTGDDDILMILEAPNEEAVTKWALFISTREHVRTRTARAFTVAEFDRIVGGVVPHLAPPRNP